ncbi:M23 family metallopeptidase [Rhodospirillaceae bacterium KN72]|uniref:M23 family metallopeptidase n=1 Tax=Pacificispira spongiicola TaxID=2729598 RepID=A0A7Y0HG98_9PROT|nr:M23 family metallopeptidase [Pacificispira spongiicola]NMM44124.1 M23 family metallopeptidase [Pacificispira spongiicola]
MRRIIVGLVVLVALIGVGVAGLQLLGRMQSDQDGRVAQTTISSDTDNQNDSDGDGDSERAPIGLEPAEGTIAPIGEAIGDAVKDGAAEVTDAAKDIAPMPAVETGPFRLSLPIDCDLGNDCYILNYVNAGSEADPRDYTCGSLTYDEHRGTDFRLIDYKQMEDGVNVVAAAPGTVTVVRDGMPDANFKLFGRSAVTDRGRGNVVGVDHGNGIITGYSHLKRGSITVKPGDVVQRGQTLGQVGLSGLTEFPHVHFEVMQNGTFLDPFTGAARHEGCGLSGESMWRDDLMDGLRYPRTLIMRTGFADEPLNRAAVEYELFNRPINADSTGLVYHIYLAGIHPGDGFVAEITDPQGQRFVKSGRRFDTYSQSRLLAVGRQGLNAPLIPGTYTAHFQYYQKNDDGTDTVTLDFTDTVDVQ